MRTRAFISLLSATVLALVVVGGVSATPSGRTFHGTWQADVWADCEALGIPSAEYPASGTWNVTLFANGVDALVHWNLWDATGHYAFGGNKYGMNWSQVSVGPGPSFVLTNPVLFPSVFTLSSNGDVIFSIDYAGSGCTSTSYGVLVH